MNNGEWVRPEQIAYAKLHENRFEHIELARRARDLQVKNAELEEELECANEDLEIYYGMYR